jgi:hypothetical protein
MIIVINGYPKSGKDKFVKFVKELSDYRVKNISSVDKIKEIAGICFNWDGKKNKKSRKFLSDLKKSWSEYNDGPTMDIIKKIDTDIVYSKNNNKNINKNIYFLHIREKNEIDKIRVKYENMLSIFIDKKYDEDFGNLSDNQVKNYKYDYIVDNNGDIDHLISEVKKFLLFIKK